MSEAKPFTSLGQIIAKGGTLKLGSYLNEGHSATQAAKWLSEHFGDVTKETAQSAILVAERGLGFARVVNEQMAEAFGSRTPEEFQRWLQNEIVRSKEFGKLGSPLSTEQSLARKLTGGSEELFGDMPIVPGLFGDNPEGLRGALFADAYIDDSLERFRMNMYLAGDETWEDILNKAYSWATDIKTNYPDRFHGMTDQDVFRASIRIVTGARTF